MSSREIIQPEAFVPICVAHGPKWTLRTELHKQENAGEIEVIWDQEVEKFGYVTIPYVRKRSIEEVRRRRSARRASYVGSALLSLAGIGWALYEVRHVIAAVVLGLVGLAGVVFVTMLVSHPSGCVCPVCGMRLH